MKKSLFSSLVGALLALLLLAGGGAKEWIHACAIHTDTVHHHGHDGQLSFELQHHHCDFLSYCFPPFEVVEATMLVLHFRSAQFLTHSVSLRETPASAFLGSYSGRGPPANAVAVAAFL